MCRNVFPGPCCWLWLLACRIRCCASAYPLSGTGLGLASGRWSRPWAALGMLLHWSPAGTTRAIPAAEAAVVISQPPDFSSTDIAFPGVAITTGVKSLLTLPCCTNCTISCHCYMPVISLEGLKLLLATSSAPLLPPWA